MAAPVTYVTNVVADTNASFGGGLSEGCMWKIFAAEVVNGTASVESAISAAANGIVVSNYKYFGIWCQALVGATATMDVKIQQSFNDVAANYVAPATGSTIISLADKLVHVVAVAPTPMPYLRFQATGTGSNSATTTLTLYFWAMR